MYRLLIDFPVAPNPSFGILEQCPGNNASGTLWVESTGVTPEGHCGRKSPLLELRHLLLAQEPLWNSPSRAPSHSGSNCVQTPVVPPSRQAASHFHSPPTPAPHGSGGLCPHTGSGGMLYWQIVYTLSFNVVQISASDGKGAGSPASVPSLLFVLQSRGRRFLFQLLLPGSLK